MNQRVVVETIQFLNCSLKGAKKVALILVSVALGLQQGF